MLYAQVQNWNGERVHPVHDRLPFQSLPHLGERVRINGTPYRVVAIEHEITGDYAAMPILTLHPDPDIK